MLIFRPALVAKSLIGSYSVYTIHASIHMGYIVFSYIKSLFSLVKEHIIMMLSVADIVKVKKD